MMPLSKSLAVLAMCAATALAASPSDFSVLRRGSAQAGTQCVGKGEVCASPDVWRPGVCNSADLYCPPITNIHGKHFNSTCQPAPPTTTTPASLYMKPCTTTLDCVWSSVPEGPIAALRCANTTSAGDAKCVNSLGSAGDTCLLNAECLSDLCDTTTKTCVGVAEGGPCSPRFFSEQDDDYPNDDATHFDDDGVDGWRSTTPADTCGVGLYCKTTAPHTGHGTCKKMMHIGQQCASNEHNDEADDDAFFGGCGFGTVCARTNTSSHMCVPALSADVGSYGRNCACESGFWKRTPTTNDDDDFDKCVGDAPRKFQVGDTCTQSADAPWKPWFHCVPALDGTPRLMATPSCVAPLYPFQHVPVQDIRNLIVCTATAKCRTWLTADSIAPPRIGSCQYKCLDEYRVVAQSILLSLHKDEYFTPDCNQWSAAVLASAVEHAWASHTLPGY